VTRPPAEALKELVDGFKLAQAIYVAAELGIADLLPASSDELAAETGTDTPTLYRLLRALAAGGVFREEDGRVFSLAPPGEALRSHAEPSLRDWVRHTARPLNWNAWSGLLASMRDGSSSFTGVYGEDMWSYRAARPEEQAAFDRGMASLTASEHRALLAAVDWSRFGTVVDVGGGNGALLKAVLAEHPRIRGVVFDRPVAIEHVEGLEAVGGDFFESVPAGGDAYVLKHICHDWEDEDVARILRTISGAAVPGASVLIVDRDVGPANEDLEAKLADLTMLALPGGRERTAAEYAALLEAAGYRYEGATPVLGALHVFAGVRL
jgi:O-methyltransferase domain/Dimerisation domain